MVLNLVLCLCLIFTLGQSDITGVTVPTLVVSSCTTNSDCHNYINSKCSGNLCTQCSTNSDCDHIYSPGNCQYYGCKIPCSSSSLQLCYAQRVICNGDHCEQCNSDGDCSGYPSPVSCVYYDSDPNFCGACSSNSDCGSGYQCKNLQCWQCSTDADCPTSNPFCLTSFEINSCKPCGNNDNSYCTSWQTPKCSGNLCVTCGQNSDCDHISGRPTCYNGKCVVCTDSSQCTDITASYCNPSTGVCEHCQSSSDCTKFSDTKTCAGSIGCVECQDSSACTTPLKSLCDVTNKICQTCTSPSDCTKFPLAPMCTAGGCVGCTTETDCTDITKSFCDTSDHSCKPCQSSSDCSRFSLTPVCNYPATPTQCVQCLTSANDCKSPTKSYCNTGTNLCQTCTDDSECSHLPATLLCSTADSRCVQCKSNTDCPDVAKSACESTTKTCQLCSSNGDCSHLTSTPVCISSGCVQCAANTDCMSTTSSFCSPNLHTCQACNLDSQCTHIPNMNQCWKGECVEYSATCLPSYVIKITQGNPSTIFYLQFPADLVALINISQELYFTLDDVDSVYYQYSLTNTSTTDYIITFTVLKTIPKTTLTIELPCPTQPGMRFGNITQSLKTLKMAYSPAGLAATMQTIGSVAQTASTSITAISGAMMFMGANPAILWALIGLLQTFYYMLFINVQYPSNVEAFFPVFTLGTFDFIPNPMWIIFSDIDDFSLPVPQKFADYNVDGLFLATSGNMILLWGLNLAAYGFSYLFMRYTRNMPQVITKVCSKTVSVFEWSGTIRTFTTSFMDISVSSFLQLRVLTWTSGLFATSSICGIIFGLFSALLPVAAFKIVQLYDTKPTYISLKFSTLIEEYHLNDDIQKYFTVIGLGKNLIFAASLVFLHNYPYTEIITIISLSFSYTYLIWKYKPYESKVSTYANLVSEGIFGVVYVFIFILIHDDYSPKFTDDQRLNLGWGIILGCGIILMSSIVIALAEQYSVIKNGIIMMKNVMRKSSKTKEERMKKLKARIDKTNPTMEQFNNDRSFAENSELLGTDLLNLSRNQQLKLTRVKRVRRDFNKNIHK